MDGIEENFGKLGVGKKKYFETGTMYEMIQGHEMGRENIK